MAKKRETKHNAEILSALQKAGWFRNVSDKFQIGLPDNIGAYRGLLFGIELKAVGEIPKDGWAPLKKDHTFSGPQIKELKSIAEDGGGVGLGVIVCGGYAFWCTPDEINENGQVNCNKLLKENKFILKSKELGWSGFSHVLNLLWALRMKDILNKLKEEYPEESKIGKTRDK